MRAALRRPSRPSENDQAAVLLDGRDDEQRPAPRLRSRPGSINRLSQMLQPDRFGAGAIQEQLNSEEETRRPAIVQRTRSTLRSMLERIDQPLIRPRNAPRPVPTFLQHRTSYVTASASRHSTDQWPPRPPSIDLASTLLDHSLRSSAEQGLATPPQSSSNRRPNLRFNALRPERTFRHFPSLRRRRHSLETSRSSTEDQAAMLSRLLSVAAAATAATLMGDDHRALSEAQVLTASAGAGSIGASGEDGSFDGFLRALQNGRIASALRGISDGETETGSGVPASLNFFRMFRFGASNSAQSGFDEAARDAAPETTPDSDAEGRMVPIIIVGIRSLPSWSGDSTPGSAAEDLPPFIDALGSFPSPFPAHSLGTSGHDSIDSILRPPQNGTSFRHRRRASLGAFGLNRGRFSDRMDDQRDHRSPDRRRERPWSVASSTSMLEPRPPPATPASPSPELSRLSSWNSTPNHSRPASIVGNSLRDLTSDSRRSSALLHRSSAASPLSSHTEETVSLHSTHSSSNLLSRDGEPAPFHAHRRSDTAPNVHYPRFTSGHSRRNGMVEPLQHLPSLSRTSTTNSTDNSRGDRRNSSNDSRSWIIYVLGGSYPENHPILTTPSLFTDNPTYEDMMLLSALLGPAKAPVATDEDVENAGGIYTIVATVPSSDGLDQDAAKTASLVAAAVGNADNRVELEAGQRCLVCLCEFEAEELARKLVKCSHLYHKECIDQVSCARSLDIAC